MKKFMSAILVLIGLSAAIFFLFFNSIISINNLNAISINGDNEMPIVITMTESKEDLTTFAKTINTGKKVGHPTQFEPDYSIEVSYKNKTSQTFELDFDIATQLLTLYNEEMDKFYVINKEDNLSLFTSVNFKNIYTNNSPPQLTLSIEDTVVDASGFEWEWRYKMIDNNWQTNNDSVGSLDDTAYSINDPSRSITLSYDIEPTNIYIQVFKDNELLEEFPVENGTFMPLLIEGIYTYTLVSEWNTEAFSGYRYDHFNFDINLPVQFTISKTSATAGDFFVVYANNVDLDERLFIDQNLVSWTPSFFKNGSQHMAFIPLNYWAKTGNYTLSLSSDKIKSSDNNEPTLIPVKIKAKNFQKQYLYIDSTVEKATRNDDAYAQYAQYFNPAREVITSEQLWVGSFIQPVEGRISTEFGEMRYVNDALTSYRHSGTDYAVPRGTPVKAPNNGRVNLSMFLTLTGNTVVIDHGMGLFSVYFHMDSLAVKKDDMVVKGDTLGTVGSTGFSTGPHLHYTTSIGKVNFDSLLLTDYDPATH